LKAKYGSEGFQFLWVDEYEQDDFKRSVLTAGEVADAAIWKPKGNKVTLYKGALSEESIGWFLDQVVGGGMKWNRLQEDPPLS